LLKGNLNTNILSGTDCIRIDTIFLIEDFSSARIGVSPSKASPHILVVPKSAKKKDLKQLAYKRKQSRLNNTQQPFSSIPLQVDYFEATPKKSIKRGPQRESWYNC
jgi:hypothetical protein